MNISVRDKEKVTEMVKLDPIIDFREDIRLSTLVDYLLLICRL